MSIERTSPLSAVNLIPNRENKETTPQKKQDVALSSNNNSAVHVKLSDAQSSLTRSRPQDIDQQRVEAIKLAIKNDELVIDTGKIADALLKNTYDLLKSDK